MQAATFRVLKRLRPHARGNDRVGIAASTAVAALLIVACDKVPGTTSAATHPPPPPDPRIVYELREKCGRDAQQWFKGSREDMEDAGPVITTQNEYQNHYNEKLNRCYALTLTTKMVSTAAQNTLTHSMTLSDVNENKDIGAYFDNSSTAAPLKCYVAETGCSSREDWQRLAASYMQD